MKEYIAIGKISKTHGVKGIVKLTIETAYQADYEKAQVLFVEEKGQLLPYFIEQRIDGPQPMVKFEDIDLKEQAYNLNGRKIYLPQSAVKTVIAEEQQLPPLIGFLIEDVTLGQIGNILDLMELPQQIMAVVHFKEKEILIPIHEALIESIHEQEKRIVMDLPEGILDL